MAEVLGQRERSGVPTGGDALEIVAARALRVWTSQGLCCEWRNVLNFQGIWGSFLVRAIITGGNLTYSPKVWVLFFIIKFKVSFEWILLNDVVRGQTAGISSMWDGDPGQSSWESELTSCRLSRPAREHDRSRTLKLDEAKWSKLTRITPVGSFWGGNTHDFEKIRWGDGLVCLYSSYGYGEPGRLVTIPL